MRQTSHHHEDKELIINIGWTWYEGAETGDVSHPFNGYGKGWIPEDVEIQDGETGLIVTDQYEDEIDELLEHVLKNFDVSVLNQ